MTITDFQRKKLLHLFHTFFGEDKNTWRLAGGHLLFHVFIVLF